MFSKVSHQSSSTSAMAPTAVPSPEPSRPAGKSSAPSIISADLKITGDLLCNGDIQVDGTVEGDVQSRTITIGEAAHVRGSVSAETVRVCGSITGQIKGTNVTLAKTAKVLGDILHQSLAIEPGAFFEGNCRRAESAASGGEGRVSLVKEKAPSAASSSSGVKDSGYGQAVG